MSMVPAACAGATAVIEPRALTMNPVAAVEPKATAVAPERAVPKMVTALPPLGGPVMGDTLVSAGAAAVTAAVPFATAELPDLSRIVTDTGKVPAWK
jgi:hypothetical protein